MKILLRFPFFPSRVVLIAGLVVALAGCGKDSAAASKTEASIPPSPPVGNSGTVPSYKYEVVATFPHDRTAFTEGLEYVKGSLFESTGLNGSSWLRKVDLSTGRVLQQFDLPIKYFGEGMTVLGDKIYQVTYQTQVGFVYDLATFTVQKQFSYTGEGWGLTNDGHSIIMTDGTNVIRFIDPATLKVVRTISVFDHGLPLKNLNELEFIKGEIFANVWRTNTVVRIDPATGNLLGTIDFKGLLSPADARPPADWLNGIAYDVAGDRLFVTGKNWPKVFQVRLKAQ